MECFFKRNNYRKQWGGIEADIKFTSLPAAVTIIKKYEKNGVFCESDPETLKISQITVNPIIINHSGLSHFCPSSTAVFTADLNGIDVDHLEWEIIGLGSPNPSNFGNIIDGIHSPTATVSFNEIIEGISNGLLRLHVIKCSVKTTVVHPIQLITLPVLTLDKVADVCPADPDIEITVITTFNIPGQAVEVSFDGLQAGSRF